MPPVRSTAAAQTAKEEKAAQKAAVKTELASLISMFKLAVGASADKLNMDYKDVMASVRIALTNGERGHTVSLWNACVAHSRDIHPDLDWKEVLAEAGPIKARVEHTLKLGLNASEEDQEECHEVHEHLNRLLLRQKEESVPATKSATNRGVQSIVTRTLNDIELKLMSLNDAFGTEHAIIVTRGSSTSHVKPWVLSTAKAEDYFSKRLNIDIFDAALNMEGHVVFGIQGNVFEKGKVKDTRSLVSDALNKQLHELTGNDKAHMPWSKPELLESRYGVKLVGWPTDGPSKIPYKTMAQMGRGQAKTLYARLLDGTLCLKRIETDNGRATAT